jgi:hypothetical protein
MEKWVQELIASDPSILGLGELVLPDKERIQPRAGRLDLLLQDPETKRRYEVEVQLGPTDEAHIIRTIEYWDIERNPAIGAAWCGAAVIRRLSSPPRSFGARCCRPRASKKKRSLEWNQNRESSIVSNRPNEVQGTNKLCDLMRKLCVGMVKVKKVENPSDETRALRMIARANRLKDIILDELYGLHDSGVNISNAQVQEIAVRIMRRANLPTGEEARTAEDRLRRVVEQRLLKPQNGMP